MGMEDGRTCFSRVLNGDSTVPSTIIVAHDGPIMESRPFPGINGSLNW